VLKRAFIIIFVVLFLSSCDSTVERRVIDVNRTVKVHSAQFQNNPENYTFAWSPPEGPSESRANFKIERNVMLFTPDIEGEYQINLTVESIGGEVLHEEEFLFTAKLVEIINDNKYIEIAETQPIKEAPKKQVAKKEVKKPKPKPIRKQAPPKPKVQKNLTIQVAAWPSLEEARKDQLELVDLGFDAYTQRIYITKKDAVWWRVRVGSFKDESTANAVKNKLTKLRGNDIWIDNVK